MNTRIETASRAPAPGASRVGPKHVLGLFLVLLAAAPLVLPDFYVTLLNYIGLSALVALTHCLIVDLDRRLDAGEQLPVMPPWHVQENKWRAARYGLDAIIILDADSNERLSTRVAELEKAEPMQEQTGKWVMAAVWGAAGLLALFVAKQLGLV